MAHRTSFIPVLGIAALLAGRGGDPRGSDSAAGAAAREARGRQAGGAETCDGQTGAASPRQESRRPRRPPRNQPTTPFPAEPPKAGVPRDFKVPEPKRFTLDNGLQVALVQWGTMPKVRVTLSMRTGNAFEKADEVWLADLTGDLMREGTATPHGRADFRGSGADGRVAHRQRRRRYDHRSAATC